MISKFYIYQLRVDGDILPFYIGKGYGDRAWHHLKLSKNDRNEHKKNIIRKAQREGKQILVEFIKENLDEDDAFMWEVFWIAEYGRSDLGSGSLTNMTDGGEGVAGRFGPLNHFYKRTHSEETKNKMSKSRIGRFAGSNNPNYGNVGELNPNYGKKRSEETRKRISESNKGKRLGAVLTEDHRKILSIVNSKPKSEEHRRKISEAAKRMPKVTCPHCGKTGGKCGMVKYHFDNCREKS